MKHISTTTLLLSNAVNLRRDISILYNRIAMIILISCIINDLFFLTMVTKGLGIHGGLLLHNNPAHYTSQCFYSNTKMKTYSKLFVRGFSTSNHYYSSNPSDSDRDSNVIALPLSSPSTSDVSTNAPSGDSLYTEGLAESAHRANLEAGRVVNTFITETESTSSNGRSFSVPPSERSEDEVHRDEELQSPAQANRINDTPVGSQQDNEEEKNSDGTSNNNKRKCEDDLEDYPNKRARYDDDDDDDNGKGGSSYQGYDKDHNQNTSQEDTHKNDQSNQEGEKTNQNTSQEDTHKDDQTNLEDEKNDQANLEDEKNDKVNLEDEKNDQANQDALDTHKNDQSNQEGEKNKQTNQNALDTDKNNPSNQETEKKQSCIDFVLELQQCEMPDIFEADGGD